MKAFCTHAVIFLTMLLAIGCQRDASTDQASQTDSVLRANNDSLFANPRQAYANYTRLQASLTDSFCWYRAEVYKGTAQLLMGDSIASNNTYARVAAWCRRTANSYSIEGQMWNHCGVNAIIRGDRDRAAMCYERAYKLLNHSPKPKELIATTINLADIYFQKGDLPQTAFYYRYALYLCDSIGDRTNITSIYCGLGQTYMELENFAEAHHFFDLASHAIANEDQQTRFFYLFTLGNCYYYEGRYQESLNQFDQARQVAISIHDQSNEIICEGNMAEICLLTDRLHEARGHLRRTQELLATDSTILPLTRHYLESLQADLALAEGRTADAQSFLQKNVDSLLAQSPRYLMLHYRRLEHYAARAKKWNEAYHQHISSDKYADALASQQVANNVAEMSQRYSRDTTLLHQRVALADLRSSNIRQQSFIIVAVAAVIILALSLILFITYSRRRSQLRFKRQMEKITELRMDIVRNRVSPHYIFNVLGTVLPKLQRHPDLQMPVDMLIDVLRGNLLTSGKVAVPLRDELTLVRRYVDLHHYSKGERPVVTWQIANQLNESGILVPSMSLQIPVENALKHAFPTLTDVSAINISVCLEEGWLHLSVTDNGCGYDPAKVKSTGHDTGTGLRLLSRTIDILNQYNHHAAKFRITNMQAPHHGTCTELVLPPDYNFTLPQAE